MANEYLKRTPTSTGNNQVFTWSGWVKRSIFSANYVGSQNLFRTTGGSGGDCGWRFDYANPADSLRLFLAGAAEGSVASEGKSRDPGNWMHVMLAFNTTLSQDTARVRIYANGALVPYVSQTYPNKNFQTSFNELVTQYIGSYNGSSEFFHGEMCDVFMVDGQALTPDVFGFFKDGDGYVSAGSTQATDFRPGQWVPKSPSVIKNVIDNSGGFGVNGFYLPMNDSSNFGADFHCDPNSIITLKGEDLPQPQNGAPTTTDAYVSQLRSDPYAANIVLAVPGISTSTSATLVTNGTFETDSDWEKSGFWTISGGSASMPLTSTYQPLYQYNLGLTTGVRYTASVDVTAVGGSIKFDTSNSTGGGIAATDGIIITTTGTHSFSFTAVADQDGIGIARLDGGSGSCTIDNIVVKQEDTPRDYSADIKGSGTNKTLTAVGSAGIGYELGGYYGSAMTFDGGTNESLDLSSVDTDLQFGSDDFTMECWVYTNGDSGNQGILGSYYNSSSRRSVLLYLNSSDALILQISDDGTQTESASSVNSNPVETGQWNHVAGVKEGNTISVFINGVCSGINTNTYTSVYTNTNEPFQIGAYDTNANTFNGQIQDVRVYKGVAKYKGGFDVPKPYTPVGFEGDNWRATTDTCSNNFGTWNPIFPSLSGNPNPTYSNGNLTVSNANNQTTQATGTFGAPAGKWYYEARAMNVTGATHMVGIRTSEFNTANQQNSLTYRSNGSIYDYNSTVATVATYTDGDIIGIAFDNVTGKLWFSKNGVWTGGDPSAGTGNLVTFLPDTMNSFFAFDNVSGTQYWDSNFGQNPSFCAGISSVGTYSDDSGKGLFKYAPPSGFLALCEDNLPTPAIADPGDYMRTVLYTGDGNSGRSITGVGFQPDLVFLKNRNNSGGWGWYDSVRGPGLRLDSQSTAAESAMQGIMSFDSDGFSLGSSFNTDTRTLGAWCWKAGGAAVSNTDGTITSQVSANQDAGFSIITVDNIPASTLTNFGHGLNKKPDFIIFKSRNNTTNWDVYHSSLTPDGERKVYLNSTSAEIDSGFMGDTPPTSSLIYYNVGSSVSNHIIYCWAEIEGFSKFGSYVGNASADGPFVYCGFKPAWVILKCSSGIASWYLFDSSRESTNPVQKYLLPNSSNIEADDLDIDFTSNGFKLRDTYSGINGSGETFIFMAFAESPFKTANAK